MTLLQQALGEPVVTGPIGLVDLPEMAGVFATNAAVGIQPVGSVDGRHRWPADHPVLARLRELYTDIPRESV
jgi:branched-subunit amino acid aminotransferase/4-amino-4-deoxychorismate lyase